MKLKTTCFLAATTTLGLMALALIAAGCSTTSPKTAVAATPAAQPNLAKGAELWAQNCVHCHNVRSPSSYSDAQWDVAMLHMRVRANLTADEHRAILAFLKSAH